MSVLQTLLFAAGISIGLMLLAELMELILLETV